MISGEEQNACPSADHCGAAAEGGQGKRARAGPTGKCALQQNKNYIIIDIDIDIEFICHTTGRIHI